MALTGYPITLNGAALVARASGALWWPAERMLAVADLHFGKAARLARHGGGLLPPYEVRDTLDRLATEVGALRPAVVACLGDSFDSDAASSDILPDDRDRLAALMAGRRWLWLAGNHDPAPHDVGGTQLAVLALGPLLLRHMARPDAAPGEVSGHYHPKLALATAVGAVTRPCFLCDGHRLILPAFGSYAGGLSARDPVLAGLMGRNAIAVLTGRAACPVPLSAA
jgi:DNA ligase-associated metallophosphoesterase